jgi:hypothetical protein
MKIELSHDLLAKKIYDKASTQDKMLMKIRNFIKDRFAYFKENKVLLSKEDLNYIGPYTKQLTLERYELIFIDRSKNALRLRRAAIIGLAIAVIFVLAYFMNKTEEVKVESQEHLANQILEYERVENEAKELSNALVESREGLDATKEELRLALLRLQQKNDTLLHDYAEYKVNQGYDEEELVEALHVAQSAKISELAAPIVYTDRKYAFQLARQAWYLNPENQQAMKIIYQTVDATLEKNFSKQKTRNFIKQKEKEWGKLSSRKMKAIFNPQNTIVANSQKEKTVEPQKAVRTIPEAPEGIFVPRPEQRMEQEQRVKVEMNKLQEELQNKIQRQQRKQLIELPK